MPEISSDTKDIASKVREIYPAAIVFKDTHTYLNEALNILTFAIVVPVKESVSEVKIIEGDYDTIRCDWIIKSNWAICIDEAWNSAWSNIQKLMLEKFQK